MISHWIQTYTSCHVPGGALCWTLGSNNGIMPGPCPKALRGQWRTRLGHTQWQDRETKRCRDRRQELVELQDHLCLGRLQPTYTCRDKLPPCGCQWRDGERRKGRRRHTPGHGMGWEGRAVFGEGEKLKAAGTQALSREGEEEEAGPSREGLSLAQS